MEYSYRPELPRKKEKILRNFCLVASLVLFSTSFFPHIPLPWLFWLLSVFACFGFVIFQTYLNRSYCYRMTSEGLFEIEERIGQRDHVVCRIAKREIRAIEPHGSRKAKELLKEQDRKRYSYTETPKQENAYWLFAEVSGEKLAVAFLADERLLELLR